MNQTRNEINRLERVLTPEFRVLRELDLAARLICMHHVLRVRDEFTGEVRGATRAEVAICYMHALSRQRDETTLRRTLDQLRLRERLEIAQARQALLGRGRR